MNGVIVKIIPDKGFGFIRCKGISYFFHRSAYRGHFDELVDMFEDRTTIDVTFDSEETPKGPRAENVRLARSSGEEE